MSLKPRRGRRAVAAIALACGLLATSAACSDDRPSDGKIHLTVDVFGNFGYQAAGLYDEYEANHPDIVIEERGDGLKTADYRDQLNRWLSTGSGAGDIVALEQGMIVEYRAQAQHFVNLLDYGAGKLEDNFPAWKWQRGMVPGKDKLIGLGTDIGSLAMCYRTDLFAKAGLPTDREEVSAMWQTWDDYIDVGKRFSEAGLDASFLDAATNTFNTILMQRGDHTYFNKDNDLVIKENPAVQEAWDITIDIIDAGLSANLESFSEQWNTGFKTGAFATIACPAWMLGYIKNQAGDAGKGKWDVAAVPGGAGNWGGSWLAVTKQSEHPEAAAELAKFLTSPESQLAVFKAVGNFPSSTKALHSDELRNYTSEYFSNAPVGQIFAASAIDLNPVYLGPSNIDVRQEVENSLRAVEQDALSPGEAWDRAVQQAKRVSR